MAERIIASMYASLYAIALFELLKLMILTLFYAMAYGELAPAPFEQFRSDLLLLALLGSAAFATRKGRWRVPVGIAGWALFSVLLLDLLLQLSIGHRFLLRELLAIDNGSGVEDFGYLALIFVALFVALGTAGWYLQRLKASPLAYAAVPLGAVVLLSMFVAPPTLQATSAGGNVIAVNLDTAFASPSPLTGEAYAASLVPAPASKARPDVIMVLAESYSASDSEAVSGLPGVLEGFDAVAAKGRLYTNMIAEGSSTDMAYVTLLGGMPPFAYSLDPGRYAPFMQNLRKPLAASFAAAGYHTVFEKAYTLDFLHLRDYLEGMGFDEAYGMDERFGGGTPYVFGAQPDEVVYEDLAERIRLRDPSRPLFAVVTTISTHLPYSCPGANDMAGCYRYAASALERFVASLEALDWFDHGILFVLGDHRKMGLVGAAERARYGKSAVARVAALAIGKEIAPGVDDGIYTQSDLHDTLKSLIGAAKVRRDYNDLLKGTQQRGYGVHQLGADPARYVSVTKEGVCSFSLEDAKGCKEAYGYVQAVRGVYQAD